MATRIFSQHATALRGLCARCMLRVRCVSGSRCRSRAHDDGFTLIELLVALSIIVMLATFAAPQVFKYVGKARTETARAQISAISTALELYALDHGGFPPQNLGLRSLVENASGSAKWKGPYLKRAEGVFDPWGQPFKYAVPGRSGQPDVFTLGRDNATGGAGEDQDVVSW